jgi:NADH:ubiquinone oxidoreductase subunit C
MADTAQLKERLEAQFDFLAGKVAAPLPRRLYAEVPADRFREVLTFARQELGFDHLCTITGLDEKETLAAVYHLAGSHGTVFNLKTRVPKDKPVIQSVTDVFPGGANYERELDDLLGFVVEGLPLGKRYPMPDDWPKDQKPLRKDWKPAKQAAP